MFHQRSCVICIIIECTRFLKDRKISCLAQISSCSSNQPQRIIVEPASDIHVTSLGERLILVVSASVRKLRKPAFLFILLILVMPTQVSALGFVNLITKMDLMDSLVPLFLPSIAAPAVFYFMYSYMQSSLPLELILSSNEKKTLPILIASLRSADFLKFDMGKVYMLVAIAIVPIIIVYILLSKYIVAGVTLGGVKE